MLSLAPEYRKKLFNVHFKREKERGILTVLPQLNDSHFFHLMSLLFRKRSLPCSLSGTTLDVIVVVVFEEEISPLAATVVADPSPLRPLTAVVTVPPPTADVTVFPPIAVVTAPPPTADVTVFPPTAVVTAPPPTAGVTVFPPIAVVTLPPPTADVTVFPTIAVVTVPPLTADVTVFPPAAGVTVPPAVAVVSVPPKDGVACTVVGSVLLPVTVEELVTLV